MENQNMIFTLAGMVRAKVTGDSGKLREHEVEFYGPEIPLKITINGELRRYD